MKHARRNAGRVSWKWQAIGAGEPFDVFAESSRVRPGCSGSRALTVVRGGDSAADILWHSRVAKWARACVIPACVFPVLILVYRHNNGSAVLG